jgi:hypothetical protein
MAEPGVVPTQRTASAAEQRARMLSRSAAS